MATTSARSSRQRRFEELEAKLRSAGVTFLAEPETQRRGTPRERRRMVFIDDERERD
jgi:hypothetical protein